VRNLQSAAQRIVSEHDGHFPRGFDQVHALPGIGRYTAGAICSIAFNQPKPVLDGNVVRVLTRVYGIGGDPHDKAVNQHLWGLAQDLVSAAASLANRNESSSRRTSSRKKPLASCSILNQSLMELGALVCRPRQPLCGECPVRTHCVARRQDRILEFPKPKVRAAATALHFFAFLIRKRGKFLVRQRPAGVVNAHLWEFPNVPVTKGTDPTSAAKEVLGAEPGNVERRLVIKHSITRYRITLEVFEVKAKQVKAVGCCWRSESQLQHLALASAHKKILTCLPPNE